MPDTAFKAKITKAAFDAKLISEFGNHRLSATPYREDGKLMTLYYVDGNNHIGTWMKGKGWVFKSAYADDFRVTLSRHGTVRVGSLKEASEAVCAFVSSNDLRASTFIGGEVKDPTGAAVALVSYNGRVWPPGGWKLGVDPLYDNR